MIHRTLAGAWAACDGSACALLFHLPKLSAQEAESLPMPMLLPLLNAIQPPHISSEEIQLWLSPSKNSKRLDLHREYDLPAVIYASGAMEWRIDNLLHREGDQPAMITAEETSWYRRNLLHRENAPARILADGTEEWWINGAPVPTPVPGREEA